MKAVDVIIVGGGLAGSILAWTLHKRGLSIAVFDDPERSSCSRIAAGLFNPVTGQRLTVTASVRERLECGQALFRDIECCTGIPFFHPLPLVRIFSTAEIVERWGHRRMEAEEAGLVFTEFEGAPHPRFRSTHGGFELENSGYVDTETLLCAIRKHLVQSDIWIQQFVTSDDIETGDGGVTCHGINARHIVLAEGHLARFSPISPPLPLRADKGELLEVDISEGLPEKIYVDGLFLVPRGNNRWIVGSTHDRDARDERTTDSGRAELEKKLNLMLDAPFEVIAHRAGIRPASGDTRVFVGAHPKRTRTWIFNGFGSRSILLAPHAAGCLAAAIIDGAPVPPELDVERFREKETRPQNPFRATRIAQECVSEVLQAGDIAVDATAGNGHDTLWLASKVGSAGHVFAVDIQDSAIRATGKALKTAGTLERVTLKTADHGNLSSLLPSEVIGEISAVMFNLGTLPGGDRAVRTRTDTTLSALKGALDALRPGGRLSVILHPGDPVSREEERAVMEWIRTLPPDRATIDIKHAPGNPAHAPWVLVLTAPPPVSTDSGSH